MINDNTTPTVNRDGKIQLYIKQKATLDTFLKTGAITKAQYDKSLVDLTIKMGINTTEL